MPARRRRREERQGLPGGNAQLPLDQVEAGDHLGHRMLDLQPRVHLHEEGVLALHDELDRAGGDIADRARRGDGGLVQPGAQRGREVGRRRFLEHLLMAALHRAITGVQVDGVAVCVGEDLHLDMARFGQVALEQHAVIAEGGLGLAAGAGELRGEFLGAQHGAHALAAAAGAGLDEQREADACGLVRQRRLVLRLAMVAGHDRDAGGFHQPLALGLAAHGADGGGRRADEGDAGGRAGFREVGVLREEPIAWMDRLRAGGTRGLEDAVGAQIAVGRARRPDGIGGIGEQHVLRPRISLGEDGDGADAHAPRGADDAAGNLAAIGDEQGTDHRATSGTRRSASAASARTRRRQARGPARRASAPGR